MRDEGESKDCDRMRTLGDGVRGGAIVVAMFTRQSWWQRAATNLVADNGQEQRKDREIGWTGGTILCKAYIICTHPCRAAGSLALHQDMQPRRGIN